MLRLSLRRMFVIVEESSTHPISRNSLYVPDVCNNAPSMKPSPRIFDQLGSRSRHSYTIKPYHVNSWCRPPRTRNLVGEARFATREGCFVPLAVRFTTVHNRWTKGQHQKRQPKGRKEGRKEFSIPFPLVLLRLEPGCKRSGKMGTCGFEHDGIGDVSFPARFGRRSAFPPDISRESLTDMASGSGINGGVTASDGLDTWNGGGRRSDVPNGMDVEQQQKFTVRVEAKEKERTMGPGTCVDVWRMLTGKGNARRNPASVSSPADRRTSTSWMHTRGKR